MFNCSISGRADLPHNLKALFRPIVMQTADVGDIAETMLLAAGFNDGRRLAGKLVSFFDLFGSLISKQTHYDSGMRALRSALTTAATLRSKFINLPEESLILRALYDVSEAKLLAKDRIPFGMIIQDLFKGVPLLDLHEEVRK